MIQISETAAQKIRSLMASRLADGGLRVGVKGGGLGGVSYTFALDREPRLAERFRMSAGREYLHDRQSYLFLKGTTLAYRHCVSRRVRVPQSERQQTCAAESHRRLRGRHSHSLPIQR